MTEPKSPWIWEALPQATLSISWLQTNPKEILIMFLNPLTYLSPCIPKPANSPMGINIQKWEAEGVKERSTTSLLSWLKAKPLIYCPAGTCHIEHDFAYCHLSSNHVYDLVMWCTVPKASAWHKQWDTQVEEGSLCTKQLFIRATSFHHKNAGT